MNVPRTRLHAFSLLEMSVVIVIIGLLTGGIVIVSKYIKNGELTSLATEAKYYAHAYGQFQSTYHVPPGDMSTANESWTGASNGDGNSVISAKGVGITPNTSEIFYAFQHLTKAGMIDGSYTGVGPDAKAGINVPRGAFSGSALIFDHPAPIDGNVSSDTYYFDGLYGHVLRIAGLASSGLPRTPFLTPAEVAELDNKYDNGNPATGSIFVPKSSALANCATTNDPLTAQYDTATTSASCYLFFRVE